MELDKGWIFMFILGKFRKDKLFGKFYFEFEEDKEVFIGSRY